MVQSEGGILLFMSVKCSRTVRYCAYRYICTEITGRHDLENASTNKRAMMLPLVKPNTSRIFDTLYILRIDGAENGTILAIYSAA